MHTSSCNYGISHGSLDSQVKRKLIISCLVLIVGVVSTIAVSADLYSGRSAANLKPQVVPANGSVVGSLLSSYISTREEGSYLVLEGGVFLILGSLWLKRARREKLLVESQSGEGD